VAQTVDGLVVYQKAMAAAHELRRLLDAPAFHYDRDLQGQLNRASIRVVSDIAEGFEQKTDRHFARYLYDSKGGTGEIQTQLAIAARRHCVSERDAARVSRLYAEVGRMLGGLIGRLLQDDWKNR
jgi:four helix bundle protein